MTEWWTSQEAGLFGAMAGSAVGVVGALIGTLAGAYARQGKLKPVVMALLALLTFACGGSLVAGITALVVKQPYHVWFPLLLLGIIGVSVGAGLIPVINNIYRQAEHRRFEAEQFRRA